MGRAVGTFEGRGDPNGPTYSITDGTSYVNAGCSFIPSPHDPASQSATHDDPQPAAHASAHRTTIRWPYPCAQPYAHVGANSRADSSAHIHSDVRSDPAAHDGAHAGANLGADAAPHLGTHRNAYTSSVGFITQPNGI